MDNLTAYIGFPDRKDLSPPGPKLPLKVTFNSSTAIALVTHHTELKYNHIHFTTIGLASLDPFADARQQAVYADLARGRDGLL